MTADLRSFASYDEAVRDFAWEIPERFNAAEVIERHRDQARPALYCVGGPAGLEVATFAAVAGAARRLSVALLELGIGPASRVAIVLPNGVESVIAQFAALRAGAVVAPLRQYDDVEPYRHELSLVRPELLICDRARLLLLRRALGEDVPPVVIAESGSWAAWSFGLQGRGRGARGTVDVVDLLRHADGDVPEIAPTLAEDPALIAFTSGSTGLPKAVLMPHRSFLAMLPTFQMISALGPAPGDLVFNSLGWAAPAGLRPITAPAWYLGLPVVATARPLDAPAICETLSALRVTCAYLMPNVLRELSRLGDAVRVYDWSALRTITYAGEAIGPTISAWLEDELGVTLNPYYGASEVALPAACCAPWFDTPSGSVGRRVPGRALEVVDERTHAPLPAGATGILAVERPDPGLYLGYLAADGSVAGDDGSHVLTSDVGRIDADGNVWYVGRRGQVIQDAGGELVPPTDVEDVVLACPGVIDAAAVALERQGDLPALVVCLTAEPDAERDQLLSAVSDSIERRFAGALRPERVLEVEELPFTALTRKVNRAQLRERLLCGEAGILASLPPA